MPYLSIRYTVPADATDPADAVAAAALSAATDILGKRRDLTAITLSPIDPRHWRIGGPSLAAQGLASFWLAIQVTAGTNSKDEKARFIAQIFADMERILGPLHPASYVHVDEVAADAFGYGGLTQERRYIAGQMGIAA